jgi:hypothetical protein
MNLLRFAIYFSFLLMVINGCKKPDGLGADLIPDEDEPEVGCLDTFTLETTFSREDSIAVRTDFNAHLLGGLNDPEFGKSGAALYATLRLLSAGPSFGINPRCDSLKLTLYTTGYYGDTSGTTHHYRFFKLTEKLYKDSTRYSHRKPQMEMTPFSEAVISQFNPNDTVDLQGVKAPQLVIPMDTAWGTFVLNNGDFSSETAFNDFFKGFYLTDSITNGSGCIFYFDLREALPANFRSKLIFYYSNDTSTVPQIFEMAVNGGAHFNYFHHDYSQAVFANQFNDPVAGRTFCYLQSMAGIKTTIRFPHLQELIKAGPVSINRAVIEIPADVSGSGNLKPHNKLSLAGIDSSGLGFFLPDNIDNAVLFGGDLTASNTYSFVITRYMQQVLNGSRKDYGLYLLASGAAVNANRTVIKGSHNPDKRMKLKIIFTSIK